MRLRLYSLVLATLASVACTSSEEAPTPSSISLVLGAGTNCAKAVESVDLTMTPGSSEPVTITFEGDTRLPFARQYDIPAEQGVIYELKAVFHVKTGDNKAQDVPLALRLPAGSKGRIVLSMPCVCLGSYCPEGAQCTEQPRYSGKAQCSATSQCGNGKCESGETASCPGDCGATCGNGVCDPDESCSSCPDECGSCCGDGTCGDGETCALCPLDCGQCATCGNGACEQGEDSSCADCKEGCGDGDCSPQEQSLKNCPLDCGAACGDNVCDAGETCKSCAKDCGACPVCGNGVCDAGEGCGTCPTDCVCSCGNGTCDPGEDCKACAKDCGVCKDCGNSKCDSGETCNNCPKDCGPTCGDGVCQCGEDSKSCAQDCPVSCGNNQCDSNESRLSCPGDCQPVCGDLLCESGEAAIFCPECEGTGAGGASGAAGAAGVGGASGQAGAGGASGKGGTAGQAGQGGQAGNAGKAGAAGQAGGGAGGAGGTAGQAGNAGQGGQACVSKPEECNGIDDDCDGKIDNNPANVGNGCSVPGQQGACQQGVFQCALGSLNCIQQNNPEPEKCDGVDNDCNGQVDDGQLEGVGGPCNTGEQGVCSDGTLQCNNNSPVCVRNVAPSAEVCDGLDNDCDGALDNGFPGTNLDCTIDGYPAGTPCAAGKTACLSGSVTCVQVNSESNEVCDGIDNDCNGKIDDGQLESAIGQPCNTGELGVCADGTRICDSGAPTCKRNIEPGTEQCNGLDDDCNGSTDDGDILQMCGSTGPNAKWSCPSGSCKIEACTAGFADFDLNPSTGCECALDSHPSTCESASNNVVPAGGNATVQGVIDTPTGEDWHRFTFDTLAVGQAWHPRVDLTSAASEYILDVFTSCGAPASCNADGNGTESGSGISTWELNYNKYAAGAGCCSDAEPRISTVVVRVRRRNADAPTCNPYVITGQL